MPSRFIAAITADAVGITSVSPRSAALTRASVAIASISGTT